MSNIGKQLRIVAWIFMFLPVVATTMILAAMYQPPETVIAAALGAVLIGWLNGLLIGGFGKIVQNNEEQIRERRKAAKQ